MSTEELTKYCLEFDRAVLDFPFGQSPACVKICGKIFAEIYPDRSPQMITLKCDAQLAMILREKYPLDVMPGYHCPMLQRRYRNSVLLGGTMPDEELLEMIRHSYSETIKSLPKKVSITLKPS